MWYTLFDSDQTTDLDGPRKSMEKSGKSLLRLGTSAFSNSSWVGVFYPQGPQPNEYLAYYASRFNCVELDNTFCRIPSEANVRKWYADTPTGFVFAAKVPQILRKIRTRRLQ